VLTSAQTYFQAQALLEAINTRDSVQLSELCHPGFEGFDASRDSVQSGPGEFIRDVEGLTKAFPDIHLKVLHASKSPARLSLFWIQHGTHLGSFLGMPATGRPVAVCGCSHLQFQEDGRLYRALHLWDMAGLLRNLRLLPDLPGQSLGKDRFASMMHVLSGHSPTHFTSTPQ
jgi:steroid delta-isomerase-like uncharacterized protein